MSSTIDTIRDWLPTGRYLFKGGPADGQSIAVEMVECESGIAPPERWCVAVKDEGLRRLRPSKKASVKAFGGTYQTATYRFVPGAHWNEGHFEVIE